MNKEQLIELGRKRFENIDQTSRFHPKTVEKWISLALNEIIYVTFRKHNHDLDLYAKRFVVDIKEDSLSQKYVDVPVSMYQLPGNAQFRAITDMSKVYSYVPTSVGEKAVYNDLEVGMVSTQPTYTVVGSKLELDNLKGDPSQLMMYLCVSFEGMEDEDEVYIPSGQSLKLIDIAIQLFQGKTPTDLINDNARPIA